MSEVIELNNHRLLNGDATCKDDVDKLIGDCKVNLLLTDPPYGIDIVKIGGGKSVDKVAQPLDHSRRERANGNNWRSKTSNFQRSEQWEHQQDQGSKEPQKRGGQIAYGKVGKPRHCRTKIIQTSIRR